MTPQERAAAKAYQDLGVALSAIEDGNGGWVAAAAKDPATVQQIETAAWVAHAAFRQANLIGAELPQILALVHEAFPEHQEAAAR